MSAELICNLGGLALLVVFLSFIAGMALCAACDAEYMRGDE